MLVAGSSCYYKATCFPLVTSLLLVKARFYTHLLEPSKKTFAWDDRYIIRCSGASAMLTIVSAHPPAPACTCGVLIETVGHG